MISVLIASFLRSKRPFFFLIRKLAADEREKGERFEGAKEIEFWKAREGERR